MDRGAFWPRRGQSIPQYRDSQRATTAVCNRWGFAGAISYTCWSNPNGVRLQYLIHFRVKSSRTRGSLLLCPYGYLGLNPRSLKTRPLISKFVSWGRAIKDYFLLRWSWLARVCIDPALQTARLVHTLSAVVSPNRAQTGERERA
jgi:hypothetical protein